MQYKEHEVTDWIRSGMDYNEGISLLIAITQKQFYLTQFTGREQSLADKLAYEICKAAMLANHLTWKDFIREVQSGMHELIPINENNPMICVPYSTETTETPETTETFVTTETTETISSKPLSEYPPVIRRIIHEYAALFQERSKLHSVMTDMPESNAESVCAKRKELFDLIKSISARLEILYEAKKAFDEKGVIPEESSVFPPVGKEETEPDMTSLDEASLKKQKKNLQSSNSKDQTMLDYQSKERIEVKTPMPNGPKRAKIEMRIRERNKKIEEIETLLLKNAGKE